MNYMRFVFKLSSVILFCVAFLMPSFVHAQSELLLGQQHSYSVVFRGNSEAIVYARMIIPNTTDEEMTNLVFDFPDVDIYELTILQQELEPRCLRYDQADKSSCVAYQEPDYTNSYSYGSTNSYHKTTYTQTDRRYTIELPNPVAAQKTTAVVIAFATKGFVKEQLGLLKYSFETIKTATRIQSAKVAVDIDSELYLKGKRSKVNYSTGFGASATSANQLQGYSNKEMDSFVQKIGAQGSITKTAKNLAPNESVVVAGSYARSWFRLYVAKLVIGILLISAAIVGFYYLNKAVERRKKEVLQHAEQQSSVPGQRMPLSWFHPLPILSGLESAVAVGILTYAVSRLIEGRLIESLDIGPAFVVVGFVVVILLYCMAVFAPAILLSTKHGWKTFLATIGSEVVWLAIGMIVYISFFAVQ